jgi:hypothetical protein
MGEEGTLLAIGRGRVLRTHDCFGKSKQEVGRAHVKASAYRCLHSRMIICTHVSGDVVTWNSLALRLNGLNIDENREWSSA